MLIRKLRLTNGEIVVIREATSADASAVIDHLLTISQETDYLTFGAADFGFTIEQEERFITETAVQANSIFLVAAIGERVVGNLTFLGGGRQRIAHAGELGVGVEKKYWNYGIGAELMNSLIEFCQTSEVIRKINLSVRSDNLSAIHLYQKLGFKKEGTVLRSFLVDHVFYDSLLMGLEID